MKAVLLLSALAATFLMATANYDSYTLPPFYKAPTFPPPYRSKRENIDFQHTVWKDKNNEISVGASASRSRGGDWDPHVRVHGIHRWKREASPQFDWNIDHGRRGQTYDFDYQRNVFQNDNAKLVGGIHAHGTPNNDWSYTGRAQGSYQQGNGQFSAGMSKPLNGPDTRPSYSVGYEHKVLEGKDGHISVGVGGSKAPGQDWQKEAVIKGTLNIPG